MKTLKKIGFVLLGLLILLVVLGFLVSKDLNVKVERNISAPKAFAFNLINDISTVPLWNSWIKQDPKIQLTFDDITMGDGASYSWESDESGEGKVTYNKTYSHDSIIATMNIDGMGNNGIMYYFSGNGNKTKIEIEMNSTFGFPFNLIKWLFKNRIKKGYNESLDNIEKILAERQKGIYGGYQVKEEIQDTKNYIMNRDEVSIDNVQKFYTQNISAIFQKLQNEGMVMNGNPSGLFFKYDEANGLTDMAAAIPLVESFDVEGLLSYSIPAGQTLTINYYGNYENSMNAHLAMESYMRDRRLLSNPPVIEEYITDPLEVKDPEKWLTKITYHYSPQQ